MKRHAVYFLFLYSIMVIPAYTGETTQTGIRASQYGIDPFPLPRGWHNAIYIMNTYFPGTQPTAIWTTGDFWDPDECHLGFPNDQGYPTEKISYEDYTDLNEEPLSYFDTAGIKVYLQVEPGHADVKTLIDIVLERYGNHPCVIGFGIDVEWYECYTNVWGNKVTDILAEQWEGWVKAHKNSYKLFLKHPNRTPTHLPENYRGELIFVNDCEGRNAMTDSAGFDNYENDFLGVMKTFAEYFYPNTIFYQIGYPSIKELWQDFDPKPKVIGEDLREVCGTDQKLGVFWVDFGMEGVLPHNNNWIPQEWPTGIINHDFYQNNTGTFILNPHQKCNIAVFSLNGRLLQSLTGYGDEIGRLLQLHSQDSNKQPFGNNGVFIYQIKQDEKLFTTKKTIFE
jgi:hypothetical protein